MPKRELADRIFDEILTLRRPSPVLLELDSRDERAADEAEPRPRQLLEEETVVASARRQLIVE
jgi:hypothetical protein